MTARSARLRSDRSLYFSWRKIVLWKRAHALTLNGPGEPLCRLEPAHRCAQHFVHYQDGEVYRRTVPELLDVADWQRDEVAKVLEAGPVHAPACAIATFENASVFDFGIILTAEGTVVEESLRNTKEKHRFPPFSRAGDANVLRLTLPRRTSQPRLKGPHVMVRQSCDSNCGHWLIESLSQAMVASRELGPADLKFIVSSHGEAMERLYRDTLATAGIAAHQIVPMGSAPVHVDRLIFPLPLAIHQYVKSPLVIRMLEKLCETFRQATAPRRLYVSRNAYTKRRLLNEPQILDLCARYDFAVVYPEELSFAEQVRVFSAAEVVVGACGAALTNIVFAPRGGTLISLANEVMPDGFFWDLADLKAFRYISLHGRSAEPTFDTDVGEYDPNLASFYRKTDADFTIDVAKLAEVLSRVLEA